MDSNTDSSDVESTSVERNDNLNGGLLKNEKRKAGKSKTDKNKKAKYDSNILSPEEWNQLEEGENAAKLFNLQAESLFLKLKMKNQRKLMFNRWYKKFEKFILKDIKKYDTILLSDLTTLSKSKIIKQSKVDGSSKSFVNYLASYQPCFTCREPINLDFVTPTSCSVLEDFCFDMKIEGIHSLNVNLEMPKSLFLNKDYLNNRYYLKKYYYLLYIDYELQRSGMCSKSYYTFHNNNKYMPVLNITPSLCEKTLVQIHVSAFPDMFKLSRFIPSTKNIKGVTSPSTLEDIGTPFYNMTLLHDFTIKLNNEFLKLKMEGLKEVGNAIKLLLLWLDNINLLKVVGGFTKDLLLCTMCHLINIEKISNNMNLYQILKNCLNFLSVFDWTKESIHLQQDMKLNILDEYKNTFDFVFLDVSGYYNVAAFLNIDIYLKLKSEATFALKCLDEGKINAFDQLVSNKQPFFLNYDIVINIIDSDHFMEVLKVIDKAQSYKYTNFSELSVIKEVTGLLKKGLNKRVNHIVPHVETPVKSINKNEFTRITIGINLDPEQAFNQIEMGPEPNDPDAKDFREFWGELATLRRFKDGTICEAVYFNAKTIQERRQILTHIIDFIFNKKVNLGYRLISDQVEDILKLPLSASFDIGTNEEPTIKIKNTYDKLSKILRELDMPLPITSVQGVSDVFSYTDAFPPIPSSYKAGKKITQIKNQHIIFKENTHLGLVPRHLAPVKCIIQLAQHSKWPKDLKVVRAMIIEFYFVLAKNLKAKHDLVCTITENYLDIFYEGIVFRVKVYQPKEIILLKQIVSEDGVTIYKDNEESLQLEKRLNYLPKIQSYLSGVHLQNGSYGPSTALIKRWLRAHLIDNYHFSDTAINILNAYLFMQNESSNVYLPQVAFLRFLKYLTEANFEKQMVIANFNDQISAADLTDIESNFASNRQKYPHLYIVTPFDEKKSVFTTTGPSKEVLNRICSLAKVAIDYFVDSCQKEAKVPMFKGLFMPNYDGYNVLIHLKPLMNPRRHENLASELTRDIVIPEFDPKESNIMPIVSFNPIEKYLSSLRKTYGHLALFFHDSYGGVVIAVLWLPAAKQVPKVEVRKSKNKLVGLDEDAVLEGICKLGNDLVRTIETCKQ